MKHAKNIAQHMQDWEYKEFKKDSRKASKAMREAKQNKRYVWTSAE